MMITGGAKYWVLGIKSFLIIRIEASDCALNQQGRFGSSMRNTSPGRRDKHVAAGGSGVVEG